MNPMSDKDAEARLFKILEEAEDDPSSASMAEAEWREQQAELDRLGADRAQTEGAAE